MSLERDDFKLFRDFIYERTGIFYGENKEYLIERRLKKRMEDLGCNSIRDYYRLLRSDSRGNEVSNLINIITTNETYFFRNIPQLKLLSEELLPQIISAKKMKNTYSLKLWSAACSTGEEPYTLSINALENLDDPHKWDLQILASDINRSVLRAARQGVYHKRAVKDVHEYYLDKYFLNDPAGGNGRYEIKRKVKQYVKFFYMNLIDEEKMNTVRGVDIIFCRNVLIYFDDRSRKKAVQLLYNCLNKGGYIFLGHSESLSRFSTAFRIRKFKNGIIYQKE